MITKFIHHACGWAAVLGALMAVLLATGCGGGSGSGTAQAGDGAFTGSTNSLPNTFGAGETFKAGDGLIIGFSDIPGAAEHFEEKISDNGKITLLYSETFDAAGKTRRDLENEIKARYVPRYYKYLTVTIKALDQFYYVGGDVKMPNRYGYAGRMTVLKAIQTAGDFTDFANKRKVVLTRANGQNVIVNCVKALRDSRLDLEVYPGDKIHVPRRTPLDIF